MTTRLKSLKINRVDLVPEGANSAAFITLYKGKEGKPMEFEEILEKMKPEHAEVIKSKLDEVEKAKAEVEAELTEALEKAKETCAKAAEDEESEEDKESEEEQVGKADTKTEGTASFDEDETLLKSLPPELQGFVAKMRQQKEAAEEVAKAAIAREKHSEAVAKAAELKALPVEETKLIDFIEKSNQETVDMLTAIAKAIDTTVLVETGSNETGSFSKSADEAWSRLDAKAVAIAEERGVTKAKGMALAIEEFPELYKEYLEGGAN